TGGAQEGWRMPPARRHGMFGRAVSRRAEGGDSRNRRDPRNRRSTADRPSDQRPLRVHGSKVTFFRAADLSTPAPQNLSTLEPVSLPSYIYDADTPRLLTTPRHYAYIKI